MASQRNVLFSLAVIALSVILIRFVFSVVYEPNGFYDRRAPDFWLDIARNVANGEGYTWPGDGKPTARRGPTVVYYFAAFIWLFGDNLWAVMMAQWLMELGTAILIYFIALHIFKNQRVALASSLLFACYAPGYIFTIRAWSEPIFTFTLAAFTLSTLSALRSPAVWRFALCGACLGLAVLARPIMQYYPLAMLVVIAWGLKGNWRQIIPGFASFCLAFALVLSPWIIRNYQLWNAFVPGSTHSGIPFYQAQYALGEDDYLSYRTTHDWVPPLLQVLEARYGPAPGSSDIASFIKAKGLNEYEVDRLALSEGLKVVRESPGRYIESSIIRFVRFWLGKQFTESLINGGEISYGYIVMFFNGSALVLALVGCFYYRGDWLRLSVPLMVLVAYNMALYMATIALPRFSVPIMPYVNILAAYTLVNLLPSTFGQQRRPANFSRIPAPQPERVG
ncbi:MAG: hypothetical protein ETSY1_11060 [Candidatus Entotheonella factor]|uniref:Glycosyltransferase RgtA/B/C/D-like domain-containing protein n=1 Tax=Entotheonella factor TaxID=1429438 RepID=W4LRI1_ENTF1|nr:MAG: hypothetical protein ETSY1_11060 [Candidatus Entotheonella factor]